MKELVKSLANTVKDYREAVRIKDVIIEKQEELQGHSKSILKLRNDYIEILTNTSTLKDGVIAKQEELIKRLEDVIENRETRIKKLESQTWYQKLFVSIRNL